MREGIVLIAHGSRDPEWARPFQRIATRVAEQLPAVSVALAFLEHGASLEETIAALVAKGAVSIRVVPVFLGQGGHVKEDLPRLVAEAARPGVTIVLEKTIGDDTRVIEAIASAISSAR